MGVVQILFYVGIAMTGRRPFESFLAIGMALLCVVVTFQAIRAASTRVTEKGVSQLTWRGRLNLAFADVTGIRKKPYALTLSGQKGRVIVPVTAFENTAEAIAYIESRLPSNLARN
jgi:hypothetical protein